MVNQFFEKCPYPEDVKDFAFKILELLCTDNDRSDIEIIEGKVLFLGLGFYELEDDDFEDYELDYKVIDFYKLSNLNINFRKFLIDKIFKIFVGETTSEFFEEFTDDLKIFVSLKNWKKIDRKNKLKAIENGNLSV